LSQRPKPPVDTLAASAGAEIVVVPLTSVSLPEADGSPPEPPKAVRGWFRYANLKIESAVFLLIVLTFAAILGENAITTQKLDLTPNSGQYASYAYTDRQNGGHSTVAPDPARPLSWSCTLNPGFAYPYCGYGLRVDTADNGRGLDFSHYHDITLRLTYHGPGHHMKLGLKNRPPPDLSGKVKDSEIPMSVDFDVVDGVNVVHLTRDQLVTERWWVNSNNLTLAEASPRFDNVTAIVLSSGSGAPYGRFTVSVDSLQFKGSYLSARQWYLIIVGFWVVATGAFLVHRFLHMRGLYERHRRRQDEEGEALSAARAAAEAASAAKSQFLANMSHELRTPLNAILGYADLLKRGGLTAEQQASAVATIHDSGEHLLTMIGDILDIAKVEAGKMELNDAVFDLRACVTTVADMIRLRAGEKGLTFSVSVGEDVPCDVVADAKRVRQVLINLLANAVKFTAAGEVRLEVSLTAADAGTAHLRFDITDTGVGIAREQIGRIFRPFEQVGNAIDRSGGTGLGLSITAQIVRMMGGDITVESAPGQGSRFRVEAPFRLAAAGQLGAHAEPLTPVAAPSAEPSTAVALVAPSGEVRDRLHAFARAGNLRAIRKEIPAIKAMGPQYCGFADRLDALAAAWQSPAVLRLIEQCAPNADPRSAA
jgi:signal transduction histidine kinase